MEENATLYFYKMFAAAIQKHCFLLQNSTPVIFTVAILLPSVYLATDVLYVCATWDILEMDTSANVSCT